MLVKSVSWPLINAELGIYIPRLPLPSTDLHPPRRQGISDGTHINLICWCVCTLSSCGNFNEPMVANGDKHWNLEYLYPICRQTHLVGELKVFCVYAVLLPRATNDICACYPPITPIWLGIHGEKHRSIGWSFSGLRNVSWHLRACYSYIYSWFIDCITSL